jgi:hypothetical protein
MKFAIFMHESFDGVQPGEEASTTSPPAAATAAAVLLMWDAPTNTTLPVSVAVMGSESRV